MKSIELYKVINPTILSKNLPAIEPCPLCGAQAEVWKYSMDFENGPVTKAVMCSNDNVINDVTCLFHMPPREFYHSRIIEAIEFWNMYAKAATQHRIKCRSLNILSGRMGRT